MLEGESVKESVMAAMEAPVAPAPAESTPAQEVAPSQEVKTEVPGVAPVVKEIFAPGESRNAEPEKDAREEQINNLNKALSIEREARRKIEEEFAGVKPVFEKMKSAFSPEEAVVEAPVAITEEQKFEEWYAQKEAEKNAELTNQKIQETIKTQITKLSEEWTGENGKPKYDDNEVYKWQIDNGKEYLTPEEAFVIMKRADIIDWQARQVTSAAVAPVNSERPAGSSTDHSPTKTVPRTDQEIKNAVLEAMQSGE